MNHKLIILFFLLVLTPLSHAGDNESGSRWSINASLGMAHLDGAAPQDQNTAVGRLAFGYMVLHTPQWQFELETGLQSGATLRLDVPKASIEALGGVPIEAQIKSFIDVLVGLSIHPIPNYPVFGWIKGGVAYRQLRVDREEVNAVTALSPEIQWGLEYHITPQASIHLGFEHLLGKKPQLVVNPLSETGQLWFMPKQQAVFLGFAYNFEV